MGNKKNSQGACQFCKVFVGSRALLYPTLSRRRPQRIPTGQGGKIQEPNQTALELWPGICRVLPSDLFGMVKWPLFGWYWVIKRSLGRSWWWHRHLEMWRCDAVPSVPSMFWCFCSQQHQVDAPSNRWRSGWPRIKHRLPCTSKGGFLSIFDGPRAGGIWNVPFDVPCYILELRDSYPISNLQNLIHPRNGFTVHFSALLVSFALRVFTSHLSYFFFVARTFFAESLVPRVAKCQRKYNFRISSAVKQT